VRPHYDDRIGIFPSLSTRWLRMSFHWWNREIFQPPSVPKQDTTCYEENQSGTIFTSLHTAADGRTKVQL
jgi:hypothetical protein